MADLEPAQELVATLNLQLFELMEEARRDVERITGTANLDERIRESGIEARWRRYYLATDAIQKQREAIVKLMVDIMSCEPPKPFLIPRS